SSYGLRLVDLKLTHFPRGLFLEKSKVHAEISQDLEGSWGILDNLHSRGNPANDFNAGHILPSLCSRLVSFTVRAGRDGDREAHRLCVMLTVRVLRVLPHEHIDPKR